MSYLLRLNIGFFLCAIYYFFIYEHKQANPIYFDAIGNCVCKAYSMGHVCSVYAEAYHDRQIISARLMEYRTGKVVNKPYKIECYYE